MVPVAYSTDSRLTERIATEAAVVARFLAGGSAEQTLLTLAAGSKARKSRPITEALSYSRLLSIRCSLT